MIGAYAFRVLRRGLFLRLSGKRFTSFILIVWRLTLTGAKRVSFSHPILCINALIATASV